MEGVLWQSPEMEEFGSCSIPTGAVSATFGIRTEYVARATHSTMGVLLGRASVCDNGEVLLIASSPNGRCFLVQLLRGWCSVFWVLCCTASICASRYFNTRYPADRTVQFLVQPAMWPMVEWLPCPSHALPSTAVQCGWDRMACKPLYAGKSLKTERYQHIGVVDEDLTLNVPVGTGQQPVRHFECEVLCRVEQMHNSAHD